MAKKPILNTNISKNNPLTMQRRGDRFCPLCGRDTYGSSVYDNHYRLNLKLWTGYPQTTVPERTDLVIDLCFKCRNKIYKRIKEEVQAIKQETKKKTLPDCHNCVRWLYCPLGKEGHDKGTSIGYSIGECPNYDPGTDDDEEEADI